MQRVKNKSNKINGTWMNFHTWTNKRNNHAKQGIVFTDFHYISTTKYR